MRGGEEERGHKGAVMLCSADTRRCWWSWLELWAVCMRVVSLLCCVAVLLCVT